VTCNVGLIKCVVEGVYVKLIGKNNAVPVDSFDIIGELLFL
jgi:hypothetical protein